MNSVLRSQRRAARWLRRRRSDGKTAYEGTREASTHPASRSIARLCGRVDGVRSLSACGRAPHPSSSMTGASVVPIEVSPFLQVESDVLEELARSASTGQLLVTPGGGVEMILFNQADPDQEIDGERSHPSTRHPFLADPVGSARRWRWRSTERPSRSASSAASARPRPTS